MASIPDAAIGATIALCGVLVAQLVAMLQARLDRAHKKDILLRTKYEELVGHLNESLAWANDCLRSTSFEELHARNQPIQARRAYALSMLYFPRLKPAAETYVEASVQFHYMLTEHFRPMNGITAGAQAAKASLADFEQVGERLRATREAFDTQIQKHVGVYIRA